MYGDPDYRKAKRLTIDIDNFKNKLYNMQNAARITLHNAKTDIEKKQQGRLEIITEIYILAKNML